MMRSPTVGATIAEALAARRARVEVQVDEVLQELLSLLRSDVKDLFAEDGSLRPIDQVPLALRRAVAGVETHELWGKDANGDKAQVGVVRKVRLWDKPKAVELGLRHLGLLRDRVEHDLGPSFTDAVREATARRQEKAGHAQRTPLALVAGGAPSLPEAGGATRTPGFVAGDPGARTPSDGQEGP